MNTRPKRKARQKARLRLGITTTNGMEIEKKEEEHKENDEHHSSFEEEIGSEYDSFKEDGIVEREEEE